MSDASPLVRRLDRPAVLNALGREVIAQGLLTVEIASRALGLPEKRTANLLARLAQERWLRRIRRGVYITLPFCYEPLEEVIEHPWLVAQALFAPCYIAADGRSLRFARGAQARTILHGRRALGRCRARLGGLTP